MKTRCFFCFWKVVFSVPSSWSETFGIGNSKTSSAIGLGLLGKNLLGNLGWFCGILVFFFVAFCFFFKMLVHFTYFVVEGVASLCFFLSWSVSCLGTLNSGLHGHCTALSNELRVHQHCGVLRLSSKGYGSDLPLIWYSNTSQICILYKSYVNLIGRAKILFFCLCFLAWPPGGTNLLCSHFNDRCSTAVHTFDIFLHPTFARWDENRSRPAWHTSPRHQTQTATAVIQSNISSLWWINGCNGPPPTATFPGGWKSALFGDFVPGPDATSGANACDLRWRDWGVHPERGLGWLTCSYRFLPFRLEVGVFSVAEISFWRFFS